MPRKLTSKQIDKQIEAIYYANCSGIQINIMDIGKVFTAGRTAFAEGRDVTEAIVNRVAELRKN